MTTSERTAVLHTGGPKPLIDRGVDDRYEAHRLPAGQDIATVPPEVAARVRGIAAGGGHDPIDARVMDALPRLEIVASFGVGYDHVDAEEAARRGIMVTNTPDVLTDDVADIALALLLMTVRETGRAERFVRAGSWRGGAFPLTSTMRNRRVGILGLGRIGKAIARRLAGFGVEISYSGRNRQSEVAYAYHPDVVSLARSVDTLVVAAPGGAGTRDLIGREVLDALGSDGILVNVGRGSIVDEPALIEALEEGRILGAGLDVFANEPEIPARLLALENVVLLPHVGSGSHHTRDAMATLVVNNLHSWFDRGVPLTPVAECQTVKPHTR